MLMFQKDIFAFDFGQNRRAYHVKNYLHAEEVPVFPELPRKGSFKNHADGQRDRLGGRNSDKSCWNPRPEKEVIGCFHIGVLMRPLVGKKSWSRFISRNRLFLISGFV